MAIKIRQFRNIWSVVSVVGLILVGSYFAHIDPLILKSQKWSKFFILVLMICVDLHTLIVKSFEI